MTDTTENAPKNADALTPRDYAIIAARAADEKKATDIVVQNVGEIISVTEYFVIVTAANNRQVNAIVDAIEEAERLQAHIKPLHREETRDGSWELLDYGSVVVHVFQPETREYYRLEALWNDAPIMDLAEEAGIEGAVYSDRIAALLGERPDDSALEESRQPDVEE
ncbi:MAG TPA: ribosome silencing factor [Eggerthellaceae bacterium]|nr:ribosome silencing factor [Eggerthellaceae bacterium]